MIELRGLKKTFKKKEVLHGIALTLDKGVYGLLGPNGAGKTTLIRCLTGVYTPDGGEILFDGNNTLKRKEQPPAVGYLPQKFGMFRNMTVMEMMKFFAELKEVPVSKQEENILFCLEAVGLQDRLKDKVNTLSGGMTRRLGIAQAMVGFPQYLVLDEPTAGLDPEERIRFKTLVAGLEKETTVLLSTHIVEDVAALCDHIFIMSGGVILKSGTGREIADLALGLVYSVPESRQSELKGEYMIGGNDRENLRVLSPEHQPGNLLAPTIEDGYICKVRGYA